MLTVTETDLPQITFATPEDVREASRKAMNFWVGALSPLWAPFWAASTVGVSVWALGQGLTRTGMDAFDKDMPLALKWPGFMTPWSPAIGKVVEQLDAVADATRDVLAEPLQLAFEAEEKLEAAVTEAVEDAKGTLSEVTDTIEEAPKTFVAEAEGFADKVEAAIQATATATAAAAEVAADEVAVKTEQVVDTAQEAVATTAQTAEKVADKATVETAKAIKSSRVSATPLLDPVTEVPVVPAVAEATAKLESVGKLETPAPRRPKRR